MSEVKLTPQQRRVVEYINTFGSITTLQSFSDLGITCLPKRISELKKLGYPIGKRFIPVRNRFGEKTSVILYCFTDPKQNNSEAAPGEMKQKNQQ